MTLDSIGRELGSALRFLGQNRSFAAVAIATLGVGIGANTAMFSILSTVLLRPLPYPDADRLVFVRDIQPQLRDLPGSYPEYLDWRELGGIFDEVEAYWSPSANLTGDRNPERVDVCRTTPGLLLLLGVSPLAGRLLEESDDHEGAEGVALVSFELWQRRFGGERGLVGRRILIDGEPVTVVGILPEGARTSTPNELRRGRGNDLWMPLRLNPETSPRGSHFLTVVARLRPELSFARAEDAIESAAKSFQDDGQSEHGIMLVALRERISGSSRTPVLLLMGAVGLVLLIACANVANLLLARASGREKEVAIRAAIGASRARLLQQMLAESLTLAVCGGAVGVALAYWGLGAYSLSPGASLLRSGPVSLDPTVLAFAVILTLATALLFGAVPALLASEVGLHETLKEGGRQVGPSGRRHAVGRALVVVEVGLALMLSTGAGLLVASLRNLRNEDLGFDPDRLLTFQVSLPKGGYETDEKQVAFHDRTLEALASLPGVEGAAIVTVLPVEGGWNSDFDVEGLTWPDGHGPLAETRSVSPDYFRVLGVPLLAGRLLSPADRHGTTPVAVVDEELVREVFGGASPLGRRIWFDESGPRWEIVGVVGTVQHWSVGRERRPAIYFSHRQLLNTASMMTVVRTSGDPTDFVGAVRDRIRSVDPNQPVSRVRTMEEVLDADLARRGFQTHLLAAFAAVALFLACLGLYGVVSHIAGERTREFGLRMTLGARGRDILALVFAGGGKLVGMGIAAGLLGSLAVTRVLQSLLFGVSPTDASVLVRVAALLAAVAALALYLPARRASRVDPMVTLRY
jgi:putative ABC transport system permease protein